MGNLVSHDPQVGDVIRILAWGPIGPSDEGIVAGDIGTVRSCDQCYHHNDEEQPYWRLYVDGKGTTHIYGSDSFEIIRTSDVTQTPV